MLVQQKNTFTPHLCASTFSLLSPQSNLSPKTNEEDENVYLLWLVKILTVIDTDIVFAV